MGELAGSLADVEHVAAETFEEAVRLLQREQPAVVLVGYYFDDSRPYRFIKHVRAEPRHARTPILLVRALPIPLGTASEADIREAYAQLGVREFFNLHEEAQRLGAEAARERLREAVAAALSRDAGE